MMKNESTAILAVGADGLAIVMKWLNKEPWMEETICMYNILDDKQFNVQAGLYYANMTLSDGDCAEEDWALTRRLGAVECVEYFG